MNLIVAVDDKWGIGKDNGLLCHIPKDLAFFKEKTLNKVVVMGRSTLETLPGGKPLKNRINIVLTRKKDFQIEGATVVHDMEELMEECNKYPADDVMIIGGASVYNELMESCDVLYVTKIHGDFNADAFIKNMDNLPQFKVVNESETVEDNGYKLQWVEYRRVRLKGKY